ncbi:MAG: tetratricopeptide repeat protein [Planctomycetes bacterium]|nr:tetratricopeptide repeat protein [Planctomycetota bacterium]
MTTAEDHYLFRHAVVRDAAYSLQPPSERGQLHAAVLDIQLAQHNDAPPAAIAAELSEHAGAAIACGLDTERMRELRVKFLKKAMEAAGDGFRLAETITLALELAGLEWAGPEVKLAGLLAAAEYCDRSGQRERAETYLTESIGLLEEHPSPLLSFKAHMLFAAVRIHQGLFPEAEALLTKLVAMDPDEVGEGRYVVGLGNLAIVHHEIGENEKAAREYREVIQRFERLKDAGNQGRNLGNLGALLRDRGDYEEAETCYTRGLQLVRQEKDKYTECNILGNFAEYLVVRGRYREARSLIAEAEALQSSLGDIETAGQIHSHLARALAGEGDLVNAIEIGREAVKDLNKAENPLLAGIARYHFACILFDSGDIEAADAESAEAEAVLQSIGAREMSTCHLAPLRVRIAVSKGIRAEDLPSLRERVDEAKAEMARLRLGANSTAAVAITQAERALETYNARR